MQKMRIDKKHRTGQFSAPDGLSGPSFGSFTEQSKNDEIEKHTRSFRTSFKYLENRKHMLNKY